MNRLVFSLLSLIGLLSSITANADDSLQYYEIRSYLLSDAGDAAVIDSYLSDALLPALGRQGVGPIGVFTNSAKDETGQARIIVVIPYSSADAIHAVKGKIEADDQYQAAAEMYLAKKSPYKRIQSELLISMECMKQLRVPDGSLGNHDRVYELRVYESGNERLGNLKVDMFNSGEVPIFLDCGIQPIFIGQAVVGPQTPNLTYLTMYPNESARIKAWDAFRSHPDWSVLKEVEKYKGTVSHIDKFVLVPKSYSQM